MSGLTVTEISARIVTLWKNFSADASDGLRIETVFDTIPRIVLPAHCPCIIVFPGRFVPDTDTYGGEVLAGTREFRSQLMISPATMGNTETGQAILEPYFTKANLYFAARPGLEDDTESNPKTIVPNVEFTGDSGYFAAQYPVGINKDGVAAIGYFHATDFTHVIETIDLISYKD